ncbi:MAG: hypothetical protein RI956_397, partial [Pseudomonadota bacterium]
MKKAYIVVALSVLFMACDKTK